MRAMFPYAMGAKPAAKGYAAFKLVAMPAVLDLPQGTIQSTLLPHGGVETLGLVFHRAQFVEKIRLLQPTANPSGRCHRARAWRRCSRARRPSSHAHRRT